MRQKRAVPILILGSILLLLSFLIFSISKDSSSNLNYQDFLYHEKQELANHLSDLKVFIDQDLSSSKAERFFDLYEERKISLFVLENNRAIFWTEEESAIDLSSIYDKTEFLRNSNSIYLLKQESYRGYELIAAKQIVRNYPYSNRYLQTEVSKEWLPFLSEVKGFKLKELPQLKPPVYIQLISILSFILAFILLLYALPLLYQRVEWLRWGISLLLLIGFYLSIYFLDPLGWNNYLLFDPLVFSSTLVPSVGQLLLNSIGILLASYFVYKLLKIRSSKVSAVFSFAILLGHNHFLIHLINEAVLNSQFTFELENILKLELAAMILILAFGLFFLSALIWLKASFDFIKAEKKLPYYGIFAFILILYTFIAYTDHLMPLVLCLVILIASIYWLHKNKLPFPDLVFVLSILIVTSVMSALVIEQASEKKERSMRRVLLQKLAEERDPLIEYLFVEIQEEVRQDKFLQQELDSRWEESENYKKYLKENYFSGYWDRYRLNLTLCSSDDSILVGGNNTNTNCYDYFYDRLYREGDQISSINLFQLSNLAGRIDYIGEIQLDVKGDYRLYLELSRDYFSEDLGYPELFLNEEDKKLRIKLDDYSYAVYYQNELINSQGKYVYTTSLNQRDTTAAFYSFETENDHHTVFNKNKNISILLSKEKTSNFSYLSRITYLLVIIGALFLLFSLSLKDFPFHFELILTDFSSKIRLLVAVTLLIAVVLFMTETTYYIQQQYEIKNSLAIEEKLRSINLELDQKLGMQKELTAEERSYVTALLIKFSNVFYTDINLYDSTGYLFASSRPEIYNQELKSRRMNPAAFNAIDKQDRSKLVQEESIGKLGYLSAYVPLKNRQNELLAYLNLPYFAKQEELEEEISAFLAPTINSYMIIFTLALLISFLLINQISKPLLLIRRHISNLKLGGTTELIDWQSNDEVGELVREYNRIAIELGQSAEELAKREREGAWREMAKQIAHEIKNPLTPMKLSIQHLQRSIDDNNDDLKEKIQKTTEMLISQIELLTNIAEAFSSFAKFPEKELTEFELITVLEELSHLYSGQAKIDLRLEAKSTIIKADRGSILRAFNNLLKNAVQANDKESLAKIDLILYDKEGGLLIEITDYGKGISEEQMDHIFDPSFTTKSSGTGLGLAIVKRSVEQLGGKVSVRSVLGKETTFSIHLPKA